MSLFFGFTIIVCEKAADYETAAAEKADKNRRQPIDKAKRYAIMGLWINMKTIVLLRPWTKSFY